MKFKDLFIKFIKSSTDLLDDQINFLYNLIIQEVHNNTELKYLTQIFNLIPDEHYCWFIVNDSECSKQIDQNVFSDGSKPWQDKKN